uniref:Uncharacterized protein n=1 Tax=Anguilla anguilla TaxID=7936 RepID=A0A0E9UPX1_ANGAN
MRTRNLTHKHNSTQSPTKYLYLTGLV